MSDAGNSVDFGPSGVLGQTVAPQSILSSIGDWFSEMSDAGMAVSGQGTPEQFVQTEYAGAQAMQDDIGSVSNAVTAPISSAIASVVAAISNAVGIAEDAVLIGLGVAAFVAAIVVFREVKG